MIMHMAKRRIAKAPARDPSTPRFNRKLAVPCEGGFRLRVYVTKGRGKRMASIRVKCGCCSQSVVIYHGHGSLEVNGVEGSLEEWRKIFGPLLAGREP